VGGAALEASEGGGLARSAVGVAAALQAAELVVAGGVFGVRRFGGWRVIRGVSV